MAKYRGYVAWQLAHKVVLSAYKVSTDLPRVETYGLQSQIRRAAVSIAANIAEGSGKGSDPDFARFIRISIGSANELEYLITLSNDLGYLDDEKVRPLVESIVRVRQVLSKLWERLKQP